METYEEQLRRVASALVITEVDQVQQTSALLNNISSYFSSVTALIMESATALNISLPVSEVGVVLICTLCS